MTAALDTSLLDILTLSERDYRLHANGARPLAREHLDSGLPGAVVRLINVNRAEVAGWLYPDNPGLVRPPHHEPPGYAGSALDDLDKVREWVTAQRTAAGSTPWHRDDGQTYD